MKTAAVYSGSGVKGILATGMAEALVDSRLQVDEVWGSSSGASVAAFHSAGQIYDLARFYLKVKNEDIYTLDPLKAFGSEGSIYDNKPYYKSLKRWLSTSALANSGIPCFITRTKQSDWTTDIKDVRLETFADDQIDIIAESAAVPILLPTRGGWCDGGVLDNYAVINALADKCDRVIWFVPATKEPAPINNLIDEVAFTFNALLYAQYLAVFHALPYLRQKAEIILVTPDSPTGVGDFNFDNLGTVAQRQAYLDLGYHIAQKALEGLK